MKKVLLALFVATFAPIASAELVVIAHPGIKATSITHAQLTKLFLGQGNSLGDGSPAVPLDVSGATRSAFYNDILRRPPAQMERYWARMIFTGKAQPPRQVNGKEVMALVADTPGALSYVDRATVDSSVRILSVVR